MLDLRRCAGCPIEGAYDPMEGIGSEDAAYLVVTDVPSMQAAADGRLIGPKTMQQFGKSMNAEGFDNKDFQFIPIVRCAYDQDQYPSKVKRAIHKHCRQHLVEHVRATAPVVIMPLGAAPTTAVFNRGTRITKVKGLPHEVTQFSAPVFPLLDPAQVVRYPQNIPVFEADVASFGRFVDADYDGAASNAIERGNYTIVDDLQFLIDEQAELLTFDTENTSLRWYKQGVDVRTYREELHKDNEAFSPRAQILTMQFCTKAGEAYMLLWDHPENPIPEARKPKIRNQLRQLLCNRDTLVVGQNTKYDCVYLWMIEGIRFCIGGDTMMMAALLDENSMEKNLDYLTKIHSKTLAGYADAFNAESDKSRMWQIPIDKIRAYGCGDADATMQVYLKQEEEVAKDEKLWAHYCHVSMPGMNAIAALETRGMYIQEEIIEDFEIYMRTEVRRQYESLIAQVPKSIKRAHVEIPRMKGDAVKALSFSRGDFLRDILFEHKDGLRLKPKVFTKSTKKLPPEHQVASTSSKDHLPYFFDSEPFTYELAEYIKDERLLSSNVTGFRNKYVVGGKVRPVYWLTTAVTGRTSSSDPNGQNYPKRSPRAKRYREMMTAPPGYYVIELDLSQAELRIAASMSGDPTMLRIYREGGDIHIATALIVLGARQDEFDALTKAEQKEARQKAKAVNFGFLYGMGWRKFIIYAKTQYNVVFTEDEAKRIRKGFFTKYSYLDRWHKAIRQYANRNKMVRSYTGRIRHLPMIDSDEEWVQQEAERQAINSPVQETGSSIGVMTLGRIEEEIDTSILIPVGFIHDAIVAYVKKEYLDWGVKTLKHYMESNPIQEWFGNTIQCPIIADAGFGTSLGDIHELPGLSLDEPYDFATLLDKQGQPLIRVPRQLTPPNNGRATRSPYTLPTDLEPEPVRRFVRL